MLNYLFQNLALVLTFFDDVNEISLVEAQLIRVLGVVGVQTLTAGQCGPRGGFGFSRGSWATSTRLWPTDAFSLSPAGRKTWNVKQEK